MKKFKITTEEDGERLDKFLTEKLKGISRSQIQKQIKEGVIIINGTVVTPHRFLRDGDVVSVKKVGEGNQKTDNRKRITEKENQAHIAGIRLGDIIISETHEYLLFNKPAGISVHGAPHMHETTLIDLVLKKYPEIAKVGADPDRPGIVHRLDKDVSGIMVIARNEASFENLSKQFKDRTIEKKYIALVYGRLPQDEGMIDFPIDRSAKGFKMAAKAFNQPGKKAITKFKTIRKFVNYTLVEIKIITGRTHQIRVHFNAFGHPVVGDDLYSLKKYRDMNKRLEMDRIFLTATELAFTDLSGEHKRFEIGLPEELTKILKKIK